MGKVNCWEFMKCGRNYGGDREKAFGLCPVVTEKRLDKVHGGINAGRACWVVGGSLCGGTIQGTFARKFANCAKCDFYNHVKKEESSKFELSTFLLKKITSPGDS